MTENEWFELTEIEKELAKMAEQIASQPVRMPKKSDLELVKRILDDVKARVSGDDVRIRVEQIGQYVDHPVIHIVSNDLSIRNPDFISEWISKGVKVELVPLKDNGFDLCFCL